MEIDECSMNGDSGAEEDEDDELSQVSGSESSSNSSGGITTTDSGEESAEDQATSSSGSHTSMDEVEEENDASEHPEERWETCVAGGTKVRLPQDLCENASIFREMLDYPRFWDECLSESQKESLYSFLPTFPKDCNMEAELDKTLDMLFQKETHRFGITPLDDFHKRLCAGYFRPDIKKMRTLVKKAHRRKYIFEGRKRIFELAGQLLKSREQLLSNAYKQGFSQSSYSALTKVQWKWHKPAIVEDRIQLRYAEELSAINAELGSTSRFIPSDSESDDEDGSSSCLLTPAQASTGGKLQQHLQLLQQQQSKKKRTVLVAQQQHQPPPTRAMHLCPEDDAIRPVYSTLQRVASECGSTELGPITLRPDLTEDVYKAMLIEHKKRRTRGDTHPELNTQGIVLSDLMQRAQLGQKHKLTISTRMPTTKKRIKMEQQQNHQQMAVIQQQPPPPIKSSTTPVKIESDTNSHTSGDYSIQSIEELKHNVIEQPDQKLPDCLLANENLIKHEPIEMMEPKYEIEPPADKPPPTLMDEDLEPVPNDISSPMDSMEIKEEIEDMDYESEIKVEKNVTVNEEISITVPIEIEVGEEIDRKELDLDSIDMMQLPIQLDDGIDILADVKCEDGNVIAIPEKDMADSIVEDIVMNGDELMQETHPCFFSLIRDAFLSKGEYRMNKTEMKNSVILWQDNPISPLNDWYSLVPSWSALVPIALGFLAGELIYPQDLMLDSDQELVPYLENKGHGVYAWIGAGRDSDSRLTILCTKFLLYKDSLVAPKSSSYIPCTPLKQQPQQLHQQLSQPVIGGTSLDALNVSMETSSICVDSALIAEGATSSSLPEWEPPKALCLTDWKVRPSTAEEREEFRRQERMRYAAPHKAFTYRMHGYSSVVGPVKGIYQHNAGSGLTKARGHSLLVPDRPNFVTILALVRDATARLPNGEGTRADICQLLKDSQYIQEDIFNNDKEGNLNSVVSGALDRLHYENDPCVRYYPKRKEWLYLHRARSESEFEMYHHQLQGVPKNKKNSGAASRTKVIHSAHKAVNVKEQLTTMIVKEITPKKDKKSIAQVTSAITRKELPKKVDDKTVSLELPTPTTDQITVVQNQQQQQQQLAHIVATTASTIPINISLPSSSIASTTTGLPETNSIVGAQTILNVNASSTLPSIAVARSITTMPMIEKECPVTMICTESKPQLTMTTPNRELTTMTNLASALATSPIVKKMSTNMKPVALVKTGATQSLLQSNQHFPHHQIQVSTSAGLQTIRLSGHSVLQSAQQVPNSTTSVPTIFSSAPNKMVQSQTQQQTLLCSQAGKSVLQNSNLKQPQQQIQQHVLPGKTLLASQIKLVSSGQIKSLLTGHGLQGQTIFIKQSPSASSSSSQTQQSPQTPAQIQQRVIAASQQQQQSLQNSGMQRIIAQIGGKPIAVQIQQSHQTTQPQPQQQQQQKVLAKVLTNAATGQLISVESLLAQKGLKLSSTANHTNQLTRQGNKIIQTQYQVVSQTQASTGQPKIIVNSQATQNQQSPQTQQQPQQQSATQQTVRMVTAQLAGKPIMLASSGSAKSVGVNVGASGSVVLGKQAVNPQQSSQQQQPIILPSQLLNIKTLHGLKVIPTPTGLKTSGSAVYARVIAPTTSSSTNVVVQQQPSQQQQTSQQQQLQQLQNVRNNSFSGSQ